MATKKITELQLISSITGSENIPTDNGLQTYRFTPAQMKAYILANQNVLLAMLKNDIFDGLSAVTPASDDYFVLNDTSDSNKMKKALVSTFVQNLTRSVSSYPATVTSTDGTLRLSGSSGTITLPAAGNPGRKYKFIHMGTSITQVYTLATTGGSVFKTPSGDVASGSYALYTKGEMVEFEDDGTDWVMCNRFARTPIATEAITIGAVTTAPVKGTTTIDRIEWYRDGQYLYGTYRYKQTAKASSTAGSGDYLFSLPASLSVDTTYIPFATNSSYDHVDNYPATIGRGAGWENGGPSTKVSALPLMYNSTQFRILVYTTSAFSFMGSAAWPLNPTTSDTWCWEIKVPISGWRP